ncbi:MAG: acyltransferase, partial [Muribaculaceae bacterium]|nr:acyltransferase [Muribaculaceae bacterium]
GIPVSRGGKKNGESLTQKVINLFKEKEYINLAVTPEGTRSGTTKWKTGFLYISYGADVPIQLGIIDYKRKQILIKDEFQPTGDIHSDMQKIKEYYSTYQDTARYPEKFKIFD